MCIFLIKVFVNDFCLLGVWDWLLILLSLVFFDEKVLYFIVFESIDQSFIIYDLYEFV